jgi:hypothetical protein
MKAYYVIAEDGLDLDINPTEEAIFNTIDLHPHGRTDKKYFNPCFRD